MSVFQFTANFLFWAAEKAQIHSHRLLVFAPMAFLFWSCILVRIIYTSLTKSVFTACIGLSLLVSDIDDFLPSKVSVSKYTAKIKYHWRKNQGPIGMNRCAFTATWQNTTWQLLQQFH